MGTNPFEVAQLVCTLVVILTIFSAISVAFKKDQNERVVNVFFFFIGGFFFSMLMLIGCFIAEILNDIFK